MKQFVQLMARGLGSHSEELMSHPIIVPCWQNPLFLMLVSANAYAGVEDSLSLLRALNNTVKERCLVFFVKDVDGLRFLEKVCHPRSRCRC